MSSLTRAARRCLTAALLLGALGIDAVPGVAWTYHNPNSLEDGRTFRSGTRADMRFSWWQAARPALFTFNTEAHAARGGIADFDRVRIRLLQSNFALKSK